MIRKLAFALATVVALTACGTGLPVELDEFGNPMEQPGSTNLGGNEDSTPAETGEESDVSAID